MNLKLYSVFLLATSFVFSIGGLVNLTFYLSKVQLDKELLYRYEKIIYALLAINILMLVPFILQDPTLSFYSSIINFAILTTALPLALDKGLNTFIDSYRESSVFIIVPFLSLFVMHVLYFIEIKNKLIGSSTSRSSTSRSSISPMLSSPSSYQSFS